MTNEAEDDLAERIAKHYARTSARQGLANAAMVLCAAALGSWLTSGRAASTHVVLYGSSVALAMLLGNWWRTRGTPDEVRVRALAASRACGQCGGRVLSLERACPRCGRGELLGSVVTVDRWLPLIMIVVGVAVATGFVMVAR